MVAIESVNPSPQCASRSQASLRLRSVRPMLALIQWLLQLPRSMFLLVSPIRAALDGAVLGVLRTDDVEEMVESTYDSSPQFYDPRHYQLSHESRILPTLKRLAGDRRIMLDCFCGQGREAEVFSNAGFEVTAIDRCGWMIDAARRYANERSFDATFLTTDFACFQREPPFEVVYTSLWMFSTVQGAKCRKQFLAHCRTLVEMDGLVVLSYVGDTSDSRITKAIRFSVAKLAACLTNGNLRSEWGERIYSGLFWHHLSDQAVHREVTKAGFRVLETIPGKGSDPSFVFLAPVADYEGVR